MQSILIGALIGLSCTIVQGARITSREHFSSHQDLVNDTSSLDEEQQLIQNGACTELCNALNDGVYKYTSNTPDAGEVDWYMSIDCYKIEDPGLGSRIVRGISGAKYQYTVTVKGESRGWQGQDPRFWPPGEFGFYSGSVRPEISATWPPDFRIHVDTPGKNAPKLHADVPEDAGNLPWRLIGIYEITNSIAKKKADDEGPQTWTYRREGNTGYKLPTLYLDFHDDHPAPSDRHGNKHIAHPEIEFQWSRGKSWDPDIEFQRFHHMSPRNGSRLP